MLLWLSGTWTEQRHGTSFRGGVTRPRPWTYTNGSISPHPPLPPAPGALLPGVLRLVGPVEKRSRQTGRSRRGDGDTLGGGSVGKYTVMQIASFPEALRRPRDPQDHNVVMTCQPGGGDGPGPGSSLARGANGARARGDSSPGILSAGQFFFTGPFASKSSKLCRHLAKI